MEQSKKEYRFVITGEQTPAQVTFTVEHQHINTACTCGGNSINRICWHLSYILTGRHNRLKQEEKEVQKELLNCISAMPEGRRMIRKAAVMYGEKETCRRCGSTNVLQLKKGLSGKLVSIFVPGTRRYFCKSCRWSW